LSVGSARGSAWNKIREAVLIRDGYICNYCGRDATTADHVLPRSKGGQDTMNNLVAACHDCNSDKSDTVLFRANYYDNEWLDHL
jgi:5-methylcytosine-specific restriction endonuclease McrA